MSTQTVESVIRKLTFHAALIEEMFTFSSFDTSAKKASIETKILAIEAALLEIPPDGEEYTTNLFNAWYQTVAKLWHRLFLLCDDENRNSAVDGQAANSGYESFDCLQLAVKEVLGTKTLDSTKLTSLSLSLAGVSKHSDLLDYDSLSSVTESVLRLLDLPSKTAAQREFVRHLADVLRKMKGRLIGAE